ncbi:polyhydroxyalkanoic acid system family protein [Sphingomonas sp. H39-1-10]|uniref:polyhydroxyalkanoic acid system family protein n=1 Tax=Sphingomonas pollutisoli TaxID=3030829 RepID=UPI0023B92806|nr:polyhydroxyalkanoic acid system family protein [Sphingomonas pollutisoli]MDF0486895.1 polyhydroxyalkanoic acid system family protein [Sphingomonas pollutisoli]
MAEPITVDIPHKHTRAIVRARLEEGLQKASAMLPGSSVAEHRWDGDSLHFTLVAMGQRVASRVDLFDDHVHAIVDLPPFLRLFADKIRAKLAKEGPKLLA